MLRSLVLISLTTLSALVSEAADRRHVSLEGQTNFRDIGGYKTKDGRTVKRGIVFRSGELPRLTDSDIAKLERLGIQTVVNFLTPMETKARGKDRLPSGVREVRQPIESEGGLAAAANEARKTGDFTKLPASINPDIHRVLVGEARRQYAALFREIASAEEPLVFHCSHGVHRTGTATAILLWGLGVPWKTVREDYLLSNKYRAAKTAKRLDQLRQAVAKNQNVPLDEVDMTNIKAFYILEGKYIDATRDAILQDYGSIDGYLTEGLGLSKDDIRKLQNRLLGL